MSRRAAAAVVVVATVVVAGGLWWLHPALAVVYAGTMVQVGCLLLVPVEGGGMRR